MLSYRERLAQEPSLRDITGWPTLSLEGLTLSKRAGYRRNWRAVKMALEGCSYEEIYAATDVHPTQITRLLKRALEGPDEEVPPLNRGLIPGKHLRRHSRHKPLSRLDVLAGAKSSLSYLLETVPELKSNLDKVLKASIGGGARGENITPASFHAYFMHFLKLANHPADHYPYTEDRLAYESVRQYMHHRLEALQMERIARRQPKRVIAPHERPYEAGREIQIDEYTYDGESSVYLELEGNLVPERVARFSAVVITDVDTHCYLGFQLAYTQHCSQYDVLSTLEQVSHPREPAELKTPGIYVPAEPCFPNQLGEEYARFAFNNVALDNALAHCANTVEAYVCDRHFSTFSLGIPRAPKSRNVIEAAFRLLNRHAKRHKSTSGSHPMDPLRERPALKKRPPIVTVQELEEAIYAIIAMHNMTPQPQLGGSTPIELFRYMLESRPLRLLPLEDPRRLGAFEYVQPATVKWLKHERRTPHVNFKGCRYKGACLNGLGGEKVDVIVDYRDIRSLKVRTADRGIVGEIVAPKSWQHFPHGVKTRQRINKESKKKRLRMKDPLVEYFWLQLNQRDSKKRMLEVLRLYREYNGMVRPLQKEDDDTNDELQEAPTPLKAPEENPSIPAWSPSLAHAKRNSQNDQ